MGSTVPRSEGTTRVASWTAVDSDVRSGHAAQLPLLLDAMRRGERPPVSGPAGRETLELVTALYRSAFTGLPVTRDQLGPDDPFYHHLHGGVPGWAPPDRSDAPLRVGYASPDRTHHP